MLVPQELVPQPLELEWVRELQQVLAQAQVSEQEPQEQVFQQQAEELRRALGPVFRLEEQVRWQLGQPQGQEKPR